MSYHIACTSIRVVRGGRKVLVIFDVLCADCDVLLGFLDGAPQLLNVLDQHTRNYREILASFLRFLLPLDLIYLHTERERHCEGRKCKIVIKLFFRYLCLKGT